MSEKELEVAVKDILNKIENLGEDEDMDVQEIVDTLERCRDFIDFCKFEFGENITTG